MKNCSNCSIKSNSACQLCKAGFDPYRKLSQAEIDKLMKIGKGC